MRPRSTVGKRTREQERVERQQEKMERRKLRKLDRQNRSTTDDGTDPDLVGIEHGPQAEAAEETGLAPDDGVSAAR